MTGQLHQSTEPQRAAAVIAEDQKARAEGSYLGERQPVENGAHGVLANAEMHVSPAVVRRGEVSRTVEGQPRLGRRRQVGGSADEPGDALRHGVEDLS